MTANRDAETDDVRAARRCRPPAGGRPGTDRCDRRPRDPPGGRHRLARRRRHPRHRRRRAQRAPLGRDRLRPHRRGPDRLGRVGLSRSGRLVCLVGAAVNAAAIGGWVLAKTSGISFVTGSTPRRASSSPTPSPRGSPRWPCSARSPRWRAACSFATGAHPALVGVAGVAVVALAIPGMVRTGSHSHAGGHGAETAGTPTARGGADGHDHAAPAAAAKPYDATLPVDLGGTPGVTPEQQAEAEELVTSRSRSCPSSPTSPRSRPWATGRSAMPAPATSTS